MTLISILISVVIWIYLIRKYDKFEPEPLKTMLFFFIIGGIFSTQIAGTINWTLFKITGINLVDDAFIPLKNIILINIVIGFNEEFWKLLVTIILIRRSKQFNEPVDAVIYAMCVALWFASI